MTSMVTKLATFYRSIGAEGTRYYPASPQDKDAAIAYDQKNDPVAVQGFAVYDMAHSTTYAVALYSNEDEAHKHQVPDPEPAPQGVFDNEFADEDTPIIEDEPAGTDPLRDEDKIFARQEPSKPLKKRSKKR